jgi:hypothetical protein
MRGLRFVALLLTAIVALLCGTRAAQAVVSDAVQVLQRAVVLMPSATCDGDPVGIARLPATCFEPAAGLQPSGTASFFHQVTHWYRFTLPQPNDPSTPWVLNVTTYAVDGELDVVTTTGSLVEHRTFGSLVPVADRPVYAHELIVPVVTPYAPGDVMVLRLVTPFDRPGTLEMRTAASLAALNGRTNAAESLPLAFLNGFSIALALYNVMLFVMLRRRLYLLYAAAILALVLYQLIETGAAWTTLWPHLSLRDDWPTYGSWVLYYALVLAFAREFLDLRRVAPVVDGILLGAFALLALECAVYVFDSDLLAAHGLYNIADPVVTAIMQVAMLLAGAVAWRAGVAAAPFFLLAFAGSAVGFIVSDAGTFDLFPASVTTAYVLTSAGVAWESLFLALALGQRVRELELSAELYEKYA